MEYVKGKAQGIVGYDTIHLGDFRVDGQAFGRSKLILEPIQSYKCYFSSRIKRLGSLPEQHWFFWYSRSFFRSPLCDITFCGSNSAQQSPRLVTL